MVKPNTDASAIAKASSDDWNLANSAEFWWPDAPFDGEINEMSFAGIASGQSFLGRIKKLEEQLTVAKCSYFANNLISALIDLANLMDLSESGVWNKELALLRYHGGGFYHFFRVCDNSDVNDTLPVRYARMVSLKEKLVEATNNAMVLNQLMMKADLSTSFLSHVMKRLDLQIEQEKSYNTATKDEKKKVSDWWA